MKKLTILFFALLAALGPIIFLGGTLLTLFIKLKIAAFFLGKTFLGMLVPMGLWVAAILAVLAVLFIALDDFNAWRNGADSVLGRVLGDFKDFDFSMRGILDGLGKFLAAFWDKLGEQIERIGEKLKNIIPLYKQFFALGGFLAKTQRASFKFGQELSRDLHNARTSGANNNNNTNNVQALINVNESKRPGGTGKEIQDMLHNALVDDNGQPTNALGQVIDPETGFVF